MSQARKENQKFTNIISLNNCPLYMTGLQTANFSSDSLCSKVNIQKISLFLYVSVLLIFYLHGKYTAKRNEELSGTCIIGERLLPRKKKKVKIISGGNLHFYYFSLLWGSQTFMSSFIIHVLSACYGLSTLLDFKPTKIKTETKTVPAHPAPN